MESNKDYNIDYDNIKTEGKKGKNDKKKMLSVFSKMFLLAKKNHELFMFLSTYYSLNEHLYINFVQQK